MSERDLLPLLHRIADALERLAPVREAISDLDAADAFVWHSDRDWCEPVPRVNRVPIGLLRGIDRVHHFAFVYGEIGNGRDVPTRLHRGNVIEDVFGGAKPIHAALAHFREAGRGVLVYLREGTSGVPITIIAEDATASELERSRQWREVGLGAQILRDLGISSIRLFASRERTYVGLAGFGIEIESTEPLEEGTGHRLTVREKRQPRRAAGC